MTYVKTLRDYGLSTIADSSPVMASRTESRDVICNVVRVDGDASTVATLSAKTEGLRPNGTGKKIHNRFSCITVTNIMLYTKSYL